ncbi:hypothetical protein DR095_01485 [Mycoplasma flocculare]|uniref:Uncharacterized protein n=2 Tax=Mesomycoplasma flocculare TaxID=2128 RepID=A0A0A8E7C0_MESFC|nr:hypothetical protein [Mesomycoplasma flocculare]MXR39543.1 hypothetical protein [Mycoplasma sp. MF12]AJC49884.1 hypothetical protein MYF_01850 [Mesomycoplasma flocculare ATCC 27399]ENX51220.1 hypothetical protein MFC_01421 [Mesomycoplasma flocculare ATCC 27716]MXR05997.1 hypothetical protein [Mesomycoplasma flocculare]MXR12363.1 hypothetical protein [Mesomycoplasma flocculare]
MSNLLHNGKSELQKKSSIYLKLSFEFRILDYHFRELKISIEGVDAKLDYNSKYFFWFVEELIFFLSKNGYALRWDYEKVQIFNLQNLNLGENLIDFKSKFKLITTFDLIYN